jgi:hypothetical protein
LLALGADAIVGIDDPRLEDQAQYSAKLGRWRTDCCNVLKDSVFWAVAKLEALALKPTDHFLAFAHMTWTEAELMSDGNVLSRLVCGKCDVFMEEHQAIFKNLGWAAAISGSDNLPFLKIPKLLGLMVELALCHAASFHRRIVVPYTRLH